MASRRLKAYYLLTLPAVIGYIFFKIAPTIMGVYYSFTNFNGYGQMSFTGWSNYIDLIREADVREAYWFSIKYAACSTVLVNLIGLAIAIGLNANIKFKMFLRGVFFLPTVLSGLIVGYIFNYIFSILLPAIGDKAGISLLQNNLLMDFSYAWVSIVIVGVWQSCAFTVILYLAGLQSIPTDVNEAALIDGAGKWQSFRHVTFPLLAPIFTISIVLSTKDFLGVFDQVVALTGGGPGTTTTSITFMIWKDGFSGGHFGYQSANAVLFSIIMMAIALIQIKLLQRREVEA